MDAMNVKVHYFGIIGNITGRHEDEPQLPKNATIRDLLNLLAEKYGSSFQRNVFNGERLSPYVRVLVDDRSIDEIKGLATKLKSNVVVGIESRIRGIAGG